MCSCGDQASRSPATNPADSGCAPKRRVRGKKRPHSPPSEPFSAAGFSAGSRLILHRTPRRLRLMHAFVKRSPPFQAVLLDKGVHYRRKAEARRFFWRSRSAHVRERLANRNVEQLCDIARCDGPVRRARVSPCRGGFGRRIRLFLAANLGIRRTAKMLGPRMTPGSDLALRSPERAHVNIGSNSELGDPAHSRPDAHAHPPAQRRSSIPKP